LSSQDEAREAERARTFVRSLLLRRGSLPGVQAMALSNGFPLQLADGSTYYLAVSSEDFVPGMSTGPGVDTVAVSPGYFQTLGMRLLRGRDFDERDTRERPMVAIVSQALAAQLWPGRDPIDRTLAVIAPTATPKVEWLQVVGVVNEVTPLFLEHRTAPFVYLPMSQQWAPSVSHVLARLDGNAAEASQGLKEAILGADPRADVYRIKTATQMLGELLYSRRLATAVLGSGAVIAMVLALVGLYAVVSYSVSRRVHELGVRAVLGADRATLVWFVTREALIVAAVGCVLGLALAHAAVGTTASLFEGMPRLDALTASAMLLMLGALVGIAAYVPARHAARIDPTEALRAL
jgi:hypothetical protein